MKNKIFYIFSLVLTTSLLQAGIKPVRLTCEYLQNPQVIDVLNPRLSWINISDENERGQIQTAWEIRVSGSREKLLTGDAGLWSSGKIKSNESVNITYNGITLTSRQDCWWQVRVWDRKGKVSDWSEPAFWSMGILKPEEWKARWIGAPWQDESALSKPLAPKSGSGRNLSSAKLPPPAPMLRKSFTINKEIASARAYVTGLGYFELYTNGKKVSDDVLVPNLTLYGKRENLGPIGAMIRNNFREYRVMYLSYDIKKYLKDGENVIGALLGNGFYNPSSYWCEGYGSPRFMGQIHISYTDGTEQVILSDQSWKSAKSPITMDLVYDGEHYDARLEQPGWSNAGFDDSAWGNASIRKAPEGILKAHMSPTDRVMESLPPLKTEKLGDGHYRVDFGQEISGWLHLKNITGEPGRKIDIRYICESPVGDNSYIMKGGPPESYSARFTWFVFREAEITNWPGELKPEQLRAEAVFTDIETTGKFECSNQLFNTINKIWWRSQTDNMHGGVASDCPHRERSPYTGDGQVSCVTVMHNFDARAFYTKWIQDIFGAQNPETGYVPNGAPWQPGCGGGVGWGAAMNIMPWEFYLHYGDMEMLRNNYEGMKGYIKYMLTWTNDEGIMFSQAPEKEKPNRWMNLGDWVAPGKLPPDEMVHTFFLWRCSDLTARAARALGKTEDLKYYNDLAEKVKRAFQKKFYDIDKGTYGPYGGNIFALKMGVPADQKDRVLMALETDIHSTGDHLDTGIFGTQFFFEVLSDNGLNELAYKVMNQRTQPSYGWWIGQGATTTWEQWNGSGSRNHPMFGGGITWFYMKLAGMSADPEQPGYRHIIFKPQPAGDIRYASYSNFTPYGNASVNWKKERDKFIMDIRVPVGCTATVYVPVIRESKVKRNSRKIKRSKGISFLRIEEGYAVYKVNSGNYLFESVL
ncbi:MAG: alpha-L-rhamnosidase N-terminal domain-containing protein [Bacteroidia bacterium]|nr:alpha-L-rhamnosidase N-terminal domain-containing protein [Bacteroidia bacterium]